jgi:alpha-glucosidase
MGPEMNYVREKPLSPVTFAIYPDEKGSATVTLYEDDGVSPDYRRGVFRRTTVNVERSGGGYVVNISQPVGTYRPPARNFDFVIKVPGVSRMITAADRGAAQRVEIR